MLPKIKKINLSKQLIDTMSLLIEEGTWQLGEKLPNEIELAESFNVSRNVMRESMKILENFGVLDSKTGIGTFVSEFALSNIRNMQFFQSLKQNTSVETILETRLIIEPEMAYYATLRATDEDIETLRKIIQCDSKTHEKLNFFHTNDFNFHSYLGKCSRNEILETLLNNLLEQLATNDYAQFNQYVKKDIVTTSFSDHEQILEAIEKKDSLLAKEIMYRHLFARIEVINQSYNTDMIESKKIKSNRSDR